MNNKQKTTINLLDYPPDVKTLEIWKGSGQLSWQDKSLDGDFVLVRLLNGRLRFVFKPHGLYKGNNGFGNLYPLKFDGVLEDDSVMSIIGIHFTRHYIFNSIYTGYAEKATRQFGIKTDLVSIRCDLTNYSLHQRVEVVKLQFDGFDISLECLWPSKKEKGIEEHAIAYKHASISTCLKIENIPSYQKQDAISCLQKIATLLSIACRGYVFITAQHIWHPDKEGVYSVFEEPTFLDRRWNKPLISPNDIEDFLVSAYSINGSREQNLELAYVRDHYLQALTLRSAWPMSVGIFTAMETLRTAFFNQNMNEENESFIFWISPRKFSSKKGMSEEVIKVLAKHFPQFDKLLSEQKQDLKAKIRSDLNRRPYRTQLERMLQVLNVEYETDELQSFIRTRNHLIHQGTLVSASTPPDDYDDHSRSGWQNIKKATNLFERALLAFLNYDGPRELFDAGFNK